MSILMALPIVQSIGRSMLPVSDGRVRLLLHGARRTSVLITRTTCTISRSTPVLQRPQHLTAYTSRSFSLTSLAPCLSSMLSHSPPHPLVQRFFSHRLPISDLRAETRSQLMISPFSSRCHVNIRFHLFVSSSCTSRPPVGIPTCHSIYLWQANRHI